MSNLLSQASLVMIPSGYKEDVVYSQIPTSGSGDLSFTRASNGTRINSAGLVEVTPWNLFTYSNDFSNSAWTKFNTLLTGGQSDPFGGTNAWKFESILAAQADFRQTVNGANSYSFYAKAGNISEFRLWNGAAGTIFNITNGTIVSGTGTIESVGNGWYRCTVLTSTTGSVTLIPYFSAGAGDFVYIAFGQAQASTTAKPYFPTTDRLNVPRLTYQNGGGGCPSLLLEKQSTNLNLYSQEFDNAWWSKNGSTITANNAISPDGTQNADKIEEDATSGQHYILRNGVTVVATSTYSISIYAKKSERDVFVIRAFTPAFSVLGQGTFNLTNGTATGTGTSIVSVGNDWYRCILTYTNGADTTNNFRFNLVSDGNYTGIVGYGLFIYGAQLEASSYPTSYIPTTSSSATRVADAYSRSLSSIASGTAYINITDNVAQGSIGTHLYGPFSITGASLGLHLSRPNNQRLRLWTQASANVFQTTETNLKLAMTWDGTNVNVYQNGVKVVTNYAYALTNVNNLFSNTNLESSATIAEIVLFNSVLTDAEAIALTTI